MQDKRLHSLQKTSQNRHGDDERVFKKRGWHLICVAICENHIKAGVGSDVAKYGFGGVLAGFLGARLDERQVVQKSKHIGIAIVILRGK